MMKTLSGAAKLLTAGALAALIHSFATPALAQEEPPQELFSIDDALEAELGAMRVEVIAEVRHAYTALSVAQRRAPCSAINLRSSRR